MENIEGKVGFITGGASGIGLAIARTRANAGMKVVVADIEQSALDAVDAEFDAAGFDAMTIKLDVTDRYAMEAAAQAAEARFNNIHVLVNNAGIGFTNDLEKLSYNDWDWVLGVNLNGVVNGLQTFIKRIQQHGEGGHIINTSSMAGHVVMPGLGAYNTSKFAVVGLSESLHYELKPQNIGVSVLCPGVVKTNIYLAGRNRPDKLRGENDAKDLMETDSEKLSMTIEELLETALSPALVGAMVLDAIKQQDLYIFTHPEFQPLIDKRNKKIGESCKRWQQYRDEHGI